MANEIFRRVHPEVHSEGKTIGEFFEEKFARPLEADIYIGVDEDPQHVQEATGLHQANIKQYYG